MRAWHRINGWHPVRLTDRPGTEGVRRTYSWFFDPRFTRTPQVALNKRVPNGTTRTTRYNGLTPVRHDGAITTQTWLGANTWLKSLHLLGKISFVAMVPVKLVLRTFGLPSGGIIFRSPPQKQSLCRLRADVDIIQLSFVISSRPNGSIFLKTRTDFSS